MHLPTDKIKPIQIDPYSNTGNIREALPKNRQSPPYKQFVAELRSLISTPQEMGTGKTEQHPVTTGHLSLKKFFSFRDVLDIINPLQHIPFVSTLYRNITHDEIKAPARILGGGLFGGVIGAVSGLINAISTKITGRDIGDHVVSLFQKNDGILDQEKVAFLTRAPGGKPPHPSKNGLSFSQEVAFKTIESYETVKNLDDFDDHYTEDRQTLSLFS